MKKILFFILIVSGLVLVTDVFAAATSTAFQPPCLVGSCPAITGDQGISAYLVRLYSFGLGISGILAVGMIVVGAIYRSISGGSPDKISEGNDMIKSALWGLLLLFGSYLILKTINPVLVELRTPRANPAPISALQGYGGSAGASSTCPNPTNTSCFFDQTQPSSTSACEYQTDFGKVCMAIDNVTSACDNSARPTNCVCPGCQVITAAVDTVAILSNYYPIKSGACAGGLRSCFLREQYVTSLRSFLNDLLRGGVGYQQHDVILNDSASGWRITEAFPPVNNHRSPCHYTGRCFDFSTQNVDFNTQRSCDNVLWVAQRAAENFSGVLVEGIPQDKCPNIRNLGNIHRTASTTYSTGFHLHIY